MGIGPSIVFVLFGHLTEYFSKLFEQLKLQAARAWYFFEFVSVDGSSRLARSFPNLQKWSSWSRKEKVGRNGDQALLMKKVPRLTLPLT